MDAINCNALGSEVNQLAIILYPPELFNEKFLKKMRDCVLKQPDNHPVKRWLRYVSDVKPLSKKQQERMELLAEVLNTQLNLIADEKLKMKLHDLVENIPGDTLWEHLMKSYIYLMIGNVTRSDNILRQIIQREPHLNWQKTTVKESIYHKMARDQSRLIFNRMNVHPSDRKVFQLFSLYLQSFYNDELLLDQVSEVDTSEVEGKLDLKFIEGIAPKLVHFLKISHFKKNKRFEIMRNTSSYPLDEQSSWAWPFLSIDPIVSENFLPELLRLENLDTLLFVYLMEDEKLSDLISKSSGKGFLPSHRPFLKEQLNHSETFMMALYKLIEMGDINPELVHKTVQQMIHE